MRLFLGLAFGVTLPFATVYLAVLVVSLVYGAPAGIFTILLSLVAANWALEPPYFSFTPMTGEMMVNFAFFAGVSLAIVAIASHRRSLTRQLLEERATTSSS